MGVALLFIAFYVARDLADGELLWISYFGLVVFGIYILYALLGYIRQRRLLSIMLKRLNEGKIEYELSEEHVSVLAPYGAWQMSWELFNGLMITDEFTLLLYEHGGYSTLPSQWVPDEAIDFLIEKVKRQEGKINDGRSRK